DQLRFRRAAKAAAKLRQKCCWLGELVHATSQTVPMRAGARLVDRNAPRAHDELAAEMCLGRVQLGVGVDLVRAVVTAAAIAAARVEDESVREQRCGGVLEVGIDEGTGGRPGTRAW